MTVLLEVDGIDDLVVTVFLITICILGLAAVAGEMQEERVVGLGTTDEPLHSANDVGLGGLQHLVARIISKDDHVFPLVVEMLDQEGGEIVSVVDATCELCVLAEVVDADQQSLALPGTIGVLEGIALWRTMAELLRR